MNEWLNNLSPRERLMVIVCAAFIALAVLWTAGLQPLLSGADNLEQRVTDKRGQLARLQEQAAQVQPGDRNSQAVSGGNDSLVVIIDRTTRGKQLDAYLKRNQPESASSVRVRLEGAPFDTVVTWLGELRDRYGMTTSSASIDAAETGRVNASLVIARAGT